MSVIERIELERKRKEHIRACEVIDQNLPALHVVGRELLKVNSLEIYKETHSSFASFCKERFDLDRSTAYRYMKSAEVVENLSAAVVEEVSPNCQQKLPILPKKESQLREVAKAPAEQQAEVVKQAVEKAAQENRTPTANDYKNAVRKVVGELVNEDEQLPEEQPKSDGKDSRPNPRQMDGPIAAHVKTLTQMLNDLKKRQQEHGGQWIDLQTISSQITALKQILKSSLYYADCSACSGKGCERCRQSGFLPVFKKEFADQQ